MNRQQVHEWKKETEEGMRIFKAVYHSKDWEFYTGMKGTRREPTEWERIEDEQVTDETWEELREVLFKKYQRKRTPWKLIEAIDKKLGKDPL